MASEMCSTSKEEKDERIQFGKERFGNGCRIGIVDKLISLGIIKDLPKTDQLSIFDLK